MKTFDLTFGPRVKMISNLGNVTTGPNMPLNKITLLQRVWKKLIFTEEEAKLIKVTDIGNGQSTYENLSGNADFGNITCRIEDANSTALLDFITWAPGFTVADVDWIDELKVRLTSEEK